MGYIYHRPDWPAFTWKSGELEGILSEASFRLGRFLGRLSGIGFELRNQAGLEALAGEIFESARIEGETLDRADVRSSVARRMEIVLAGAVRRGSPETDARAEMMLDATRNWAAPMTAERLFSWHAALFPTGWSGLVRVRTGAFRTDETGPMQVVSRHGAAERVHFEAPPAAALPAETASLLAWLNDDAGAPPPLVRAALAHLRFLTLHPFEDGNGRLARALTEWVLARTERSGMRFYSLSARIQKEKSGYYDELERAQRGTMDATRWIGWFAGCHLRAVEDAEESLASIFRKADFWRRHAADGIAPGPRDMLNRLLDGLEGNLTSGKWAKIRKVSQDTASREIGTLVDAGILVRRGRARATHYVLAGP
ncbi:MAG: Fic family protein [Kiritimatiellae bacterium]|nr:Fic family protein [Kiritimatiellia bacterium]